MEISMVHIPKLNVNKYRILLLDSRDKQYMKNQYLFIRMKGEARWRSKTL